MNEEYVIVRTYTAGVFAGFLESRNGKEVVAFRSQDLVLVGGYGSGDGDGDGDG